MSEIPSELVRFKETVGSSIDSMQSKIEDLVATFTTVMNSTVSAKESIDSFYNSSKKTDVIDAFSSIDTECKDVIQCLSSDVSKILSESRTLIYKVGQLESLEKEIEMLRQKLNNNSDSNIRLNTQKILDSRVQEYDKILSEAQKILNELKAYSRTVNVQSSGDNASSISSHLVGSSFGIETFNIDGYEIECYVSLPKYEEEVSLPVMMYMYGLDMNDHGAELGTYAGLGKLINEGTIKIDDAIIGIPVVRNGMMYEQKPFRDALAKLPLAIAKKYNGDTKRLSLAGTSYGAVTSYRIVDENPGIFSGIMAVYGACDINHPENFKNMKIVNITGRGGTNHTNINYIKSISDQLKGIANVSFSSYDDTWNHSNTGTRAFSERNASGRLLVEDVINWQKHTLDRDQTNTYYA